MDRIIQPGKLSGRLQAPPSKSCAHRILICAALSDRQADILCGEVGADVQATIACLRALGADIQETKQGFHVKPISNTPENAVLPCGESASTLRFLLPIAGALGVNASFLMDGRLPQRPLSPLWEEMERMGYRLSRPTENSILCTGQLRTGAYRMDGSVSSQFLSGLLMALQLLPGSSLSILGQVHSKPYLDLTRNVISCFPAEGPIEVEGDWSNAAFFLAAKRLGSQVDITGLSQNSWQGDRTVEELLDRLEKHCVISARDIPDLIPILSVFAAFKQGAVFTDIARLRLKESDRVAAIVAMLTALSAHAEAEDDRLIIYPSAPIGGIVDARNDHRIAMAAAIAATSCQKPVTILGAECVRKSYPSFWEDYQQLGGRL